MRSTVGIPLLSAQAVAEGQGGGGCQPVCGESDSYARVSQYVVESNKTGAKEQFLLIYPSSLKIKVTKLKQLT